MTNVFNFFIRQFLINRTVDFINYNGWWYLLIIPQVVVISGETGCGKTTQLPQYILESEIDAAHGAVCSIICTQPRRISAMTVSERVAAERGEKLGESVSSASNDSDSTCIKQL